MLGHSSGISTVHMYDEHGLLPVSSGKSERHRLNRTGNRKLNSAIHMIAVTQARMHPPAIAFMERKGSEGMSNREAMRCLKRHISRTVYKTMLRAEKARAADVVQVSTSQPIRSPSRCRIDIGATLDAHDVVVSCSRKLRGLSATLLGRMEDHLVESALVIYATTESDAQATPALRDALSQLRSLGGDVREIESPAAFGELAGAAIEVLVSEQFQAFTNVVQTGGALWVVIRAAKAAGRRIRVGKTASTVLAASEIAGQLEQEHPDEATDDIEPVVWGPMRAEPVTGISNDLFVTDGATEDCMYLVAFVLPWHRRRARTYWYLITNSGHVAASWHTQTFQERLPDFLQPGYS